MKIVSASLCFFLVGLIMATANAQPLKVLTYNIRFDNPADSINAWPNRRDRVVELLKMTAPEIFGVQEALHHQLGYILQFMPGYAMEGVGRDDGKKAGEYSALFYKKDVFEKKDGGTFWLSETPNKPGSKSWDAAITRVATWVKLLDKRNGRSFVFMNTHFDHIGVEAREKSAVLLKQKAAEIAGDLPVIITGDFNAMPEDAPYQRMVDGSVIGLTDPASEPEGTFCTFKVDSEPCRRIDYIFITSHWRADKYKVLHDNNGVYYPSDHLPVVVTLGWSD